MNEKVFKEFCEDCGCPLDVCCKPKKPVVEVEWLEKWVEEHKFRSGQVTDLILGLELITDVKNQVAKK